MRASCACSCLRERGEHPQAARTRRPCNSGRVLPSRAPLPHGSPISMLHDEECKTSDTFVWPQDYTAAVHCNVFGRKFKLFFNTKHSHGSGLSLRNHTLSLKELRKELSGEGCCSRAVLVLPCPDTPLSTVPLVSDLRHAAPRSPALARPWATGSLIRVPQLRAASGTVCPAGLGLSMSPGGQVAAVLCMIDVGQERCRLCWGSSSGGCSAAHREECGPSQGQLAGVSSPPRGAGRPGLSPRRLGAKPQLTEGCRTSTCRNPRARAPKAAGGQSVALGWPLLRTATSIQGPGPFSQGEQRGHKEPRMSLFLVLYHPAPPSLLVWAAPQSSWHQGRALLCYGKYSCRLCPVASCFVPLPVSPDGSGHVDQRPMCLRLGFLSLASVHGV